MGINCIFLSVCRTNIWIQEAEALQYQREKALQSGKNVEAIYGQRFSRLNAELKQ